MMVGATNIFTELAALMTLTIGRFIVVLEQDALESRSCFRFNHTIKATQVAKHTIGDLYFATLDHPGSRGPGFGLIPAEASEGRVRFGAIELTRASIDAQPEAYRNVAITEVMIKKSVCWMHDCLYYLT